MSGLADELLADLDDLSDHDEGYEAQEPAASCSTAGVKRKATGEPDADMSDEGGDDEEECEKEIDQQTINFRGTCQTRPN